MSEHIKSGGQIRKELKKADFLKDKSLWLHLNSKLWTDLSWLRKQIEDEINLFESMGEDGTKECEELVWVLKLLEEK